MFGLANYHQIYSFLSLFMFFRSSGNQIKAYHAAIRRSDITSDDQPNYLMINDSMDLLPFPPIEIIHQKLDNLIPERARGSDMFVHSLSFCSEQDTAPQFDNLPFNKAMLPGEFPILDHIDVLLTEQNEYTAGGSYRKFLGKSVEFLKEHRQMTNDYDPKIKQIFFNETPKKQVNAFVSQINSIIRDTGKDHFGYMPSHVVVFHMEYITLKDDETATVKTTLKKDSNIVTYRDCKLPARVILFVGNTRFDIVFPWKRAGLWYYLEIDGLAEDCYNRVFSKITGLSCGFDIDLNVKNLSAFVACHYKFRNCNENIKINIVDLGVLLLLAGANRVPYDLSALLYLFTGGLHHRQTKLEIANKDLIGSQLSTSVNKYIHSKIISVDVIIQTANLYLLITMIPTPGIGWFVTNKQPVNLLSWFNNLLTTTLKNVSIDNMYEIFHKPREHNVTECLDMINVPVDHDGVLYLLHLSQLIPTWRGVTGGGCITDIQAISHLVYNAVPIFTDQGCPFTLRWARDEGHSDHTLGKLHSEGHKISSVLHSKSAVNFDKNIRHVLPLNVLGNIQEFKGDFDEMLAEIGEKSGLTDLSNKQIFALSMWAHPLTTAEVFHNHEFGNKANLDAKAYLYVWPLVSVLGGRVYNDPEALTSVKDDITEVRNKKRFLCEYFKSKDPNQIDSKKQKAADNFKRICKKVNVKPDEIVEAVDCIGPEICVQVQDILGEGLLQETREWNCEVIIDPRIDNSRKPAEEEASDESNVSVVEDDLDELEADVAAESLNGELLLDI